jgi:hypothetical protein
MAEFQVTERVYEQLPDGRTILAAVPGDKISQERAKALGLVGKGEAIQHPPVQDDHLAEGLEPREGPEADARATGDTAEGKARSRKK